MTYIESKWCFQSLEIMGLGQKEIKHGEERGERRKARR